MLVRYSTNGQGQSRPVANIFTRAEHHIDPSRIEPKAIWIIERLRQAGFEGYIVGGAVRDLILGKTPKDIDIATNAHPKKIKKIFWNSRIIGKRFKLVHIHFAQLIFEVSTFRAAANGNEQNNLYGSMEEDARRRDFSINALYYCPLDEQLFDFLDAMKDFKSRTVRSVVPLETTFIEDPVRMIRGIKYANITGFTMSFRLRKAVKRHRHELKRCSSSRMTEEIFKILQSGCACLIMRDLMKYRLFSSMLPVLHDLLQGGMSKGLTSEFERSLLALDAQIATGAAVQKSHMLAALVRPFLVIPETYENTSELFREVFKQVKDLISPITPPNRDIELAVSDIFESEEIKVPKHAVRKPKVPVARQHHKHDEKARSSRVKRRRRHPHGKAKQNTPGA